MWLNEYPSKDAIRKHVEAAKAHAKRIGRPVTAAIGTRVRGPAMSRSQYELCVLEWEARSYEEANVGNNSVQASVYPIEVVQPEAADTRETIATSAADPLVVDDHCNGCGEFEAECVCATTSKRSGS